MRLVSIDSVLWSGHNGGAIFNAHTQDGRKHRIIAKSDVMPRPPVPGESWEIEGVQQQHPQYGPQVAASRAVLKRPSGRLIVNLITHSKKFVGLGETRARQLWETFGDAIYGMLDAGDPAPFAAVVGEQQASVLIEAWAEVAAEARVCGWLDRRGVTVALANRLLAIYGADTVEKLEENPYRLLAFTSWKTAETLAYAMGVSSEDDRRLIAATDAVVYKRLQRAHTSAAQEDFTRELQRLLGFPKETARKALQLGLEAAAVVRSGDDIQGLGVASMERFIAERIQAMLGGGYEAEQMSFRVAPDVGFLDRFFRSFHNRHGIALNPEQREAVGMALTQPVSIICGGAGVGKTTVLRGLIEAAEPLGTQVFLMALSGRAARRMAEATGREARTIAGFLRAVEKQEVVLDAEPVIAVDEASMLDLPIMYRLLRRMQPGCRLLLLGDPGQLPPIGFGLVFHALVDSELVPTVELTEVHRQAAETGIPQVSKDIRAGVVPELSPYPGLGTGVSLVECSPEAAADMILDVVHELGGFGRVQVINAVKAGETGTRAINQFFHDLLSPGHPEMHGFAEGEPVIWTQNDYDRGLMNGSLGTVREVTDEGLVIGWDEGEMFIDDVSRMELAYAITTHKGQGSQWERVVMPVFPSRILDRTLLYTAVTRAQKQVVLIGDRDAFEAAVTEPPSHSQRETGMRYHLEMPYAEAV